jgi:undecaprenyl-diphosphatase
MSDPLGWGAALLLGTLQGVTEFLPISSSGHLAIAERLLGLHEGDLALVILVHAGTLLAVALVFRAQLAELVKGALQIPRHLGQAPSNWPPAARAAALVAIATVPGVLAGYFLEDAIEASFDRMDQVGWQFIATGILLAATRWVRPGSRDVSWTDALVIGVAQAVSILPAISRSGATIAAALFLGVSRPKAGEFSFVISVPIILGAVLLELPKITGGAFAGQLGPLAAAFVSSFAAGWISLVWLMGVIRAGRFHRFAPYCVVVGILAIVLAA